MLRQLGEDAAHRDLLRRQVLLRPKKEGITSTMGRSKPSRGVLFSHANLSYRASIHPASHLLSVRQQSGIETDTDTNRPFAFYLWPSEPLHRQRSLHANGTPERMMRDRETQTDGE